MATVINRKTKKLKNKARRVRQWHQKLKEGVDTAKSAACT